MSTTQNADCESAGSEAAPRAEGLHEDPHEVELLLNGYDGQQGFADRVHVENIHKTPVPRLEPKDALVYRGPAPAKKPEEIFINWKRIHVPELRLGHNAHLLLIQGISASQFFLASSLRRPKLDKMVDGPLVFIAGELSAVYDSTPCWRNLVLGQLYKSNVEKTGVHDVFLALSHYEAARRKRHGT